MIVNILTFRSMSLLRPYADNHVCPQLGVPLHSRRKYILLSSYHVPSHFHREVRLEHPKFPLFAKLGLRWFAVPTITSERFVTLYI